MLLSLNAERLTDSLVSLFLHISSVAVSWGTSLWYFCHWLLCSTNLFIRMGIWLDKDLVQTSNTVYCAWKVWHFSIIFMLLSLLFRITPSSAFMHCVYENTYMHRCVYAPEGDSW